MRATKGGTLLLVATLVALLVVAVSSPAKASLPPAGELAAPLEPDPFTQLLEASARAAELARESEPGPSSLRLFGRVPCGDGFFVGECAEARALASLKVHVGAFDLGGEEYLQAGQRFSWKPRWLFQNRYYDPELARFISTDPLGYVNGPSMYAFAGNDPVNMGDPLGLFDNPRMDQGADAAGQITRDLVEMARQRARDRARKVAEGVVAVRMGMWKGATEQEWREEVHAYLVRELGFTHGSDAMWQLFGPPGLCETRACEIFRQTNRNLGDAGPVFSFVFELEMMLLPGLKSSGAGDEVASLGRLSPALGKFPYGFESAVAFERFSTALYRGLSKAGYGDAKVLFQGSSVTGKKFTTGAPFDVGRLSDFDIALAGKELLQRAKQLGIPLRSAGSRTGPLSAQQLEALGLRDLAAQLSQQAGREVNFMVYESVEAAASRSSSLLAPP